jgi:hypothetical protein
MIVLYKVCIEYVYIGCAVVQNLKLLCGWFCVCILILEEEQ